MTITQGAHPQETPQKEAREEMDKGKEIWITHNLTLLTHHENVCLRMNIMSYKMHLDHLAYFLGVKDMQCRQIQRKERNLQEQTRYPIGI